MAVIRLLDWQPLPQGLLLGLPLAVIALCVAGSLLPAWSASRVPPVIELQRGGVRYGRRQAGSVSTLWRYAWNEIRRRSVRSLLTGIASSLSAGLLVLLLGVTLQQRGMLGGTLLGEFILVSVERFHYAIVGIGFALAALSTFNGLLNSILERRREIGVLKAIGWRTVSVVRLFILQGLLLGMAGGLLGALAGVLAYFYLYRSISYSLTMVILLGVSVLPWWELWRQSIRRGWQRAYRRRRRFGMNNQTVSDPWTYVVVNDIWLKIAPLARPRHCSCSKKT